ncbi:hypothetical protein, partial [Lachnospira eligens]|uniref:hypothetical protein n=1 Tax=Lachnospira eligens TaxID=39485 RepID=UPI000FEF6EEF
TVGSGEDSDAFRGISVGNKVYKDTIRRLGEQLTSQDVGRYSYNGVQDTWCGTASGQTLFTNDIVYLLGASSYTTYDSSNINDVNAFADEYNWGWNGSASYENGQYHPSIADKKLTTLSYGGNEYIVMSLNIGARTASVLTPDGEKTLTASSLMTFRSRSMIAMFLGDKPFFDLHYNYIKRKDGFFMRTRIPRKITGAALAASMIL